MPAALLAPPACHYRRRLGAVWDASLAEQRPSLRPAGCLLAAFRSFSAPFVPSWDFLRRISVGCLRWRGWLAFFPLQIPTADSIRYAGFPALWMPEP